MATAKKKAPAKRTTATHKKTTAKSPAKKPGKDNIFKTALDDALGQMDDFVGSVKLKAKHLAAREQLMQKKAELAAKAEADKARHLAQQAEKWVKARIKSDTRKLKALERKLARQLRSAERKLAAQVKAAEKKANKQGKALQKTLESNAKKAFGKPAPGTKAAAPKKKAAAPKKKAAAGTAPRAKK